MLAESLFLTILLFTVSWYFTTVKLELLTLFTKILVYLFNCLAMLVLIFIDLIISFSILIRKEVLTVLVYCCRCPGSL